MTTPHTREQEEDTPNGATLSARSADSAWSPAIHWQPLGKDGSMSMEYELGEYVIAARVILGGNGRWTTYVYLSLLGRPKKSGKGRIVGKVLRHEMPSQFSVRGDAFKWANKMWAEVFDEAEDYADADYFKKAKAESETRNNSSGGKPNAASVAGEA